MSSMVIGDGAGDVGEWNLTNRGSYEHSNPRNDFFGNFRRREILRIDTRSRVAILDRPGFLCARWGICGGSRFCRNWAERRLNNLRINIRDQIKQSRRSVSISHSFTWPTWRPHRKQQATPSDSPAILIQDEPQLISTSSQIRMPAPLMIAHGCMARNRPFA